jgi:DNA-binding beta-propeller fold protein YncE
MYDAATGVLLGAMPAGDGPRGVAVDERLGRIFIADWGPAFGAKGTVTIIDERRGRLTRAVPVGPNPWTMAVAPTTGRVFVTDAHGISMLDARTGAVARTIPLAGAGFTPLAIDARTGHGFAVRAHGNMFGRPIAGENTVSMLDTTSGALLRMVPDLHGPIAAAVDARTDQVFVANQDGTVVVLNGRSGAVVRTVTISPRVLANGVAVDERTGRVFVTSYDQGTFKGHVSMLDGRTGAVVVTRPAGMMGAVAVAPWIRHVFVLTDQGVMMLDAASGRVLRMTAIGSSPTSLVADPRSGHIFVALGNGRLAVINARTGARLL